MNFQFTKYISLASFLLIAIVLGSCQFDKEINVISTELLGIQNYLKENLECDLVLVSKYEKSGGKRKKLSMSLVGCNFQNPRIEARRIQGLLKVEFDFLCEIKIIEYNFINEGKTNSVKFYDCNEL